MAELDVCPHCGVYRVFEGRTDECCQIKLRRPCVFDKGMCNGNKEDKESHRGTNSAEQPVARLDYTNREVVLSAVKQDGYILVCAPRFRSDRMVVLEAVKQNGCALECADASLRNDRDIVIEALKQNGLAFMYIHPSLKEDADVALLALRQNAKSFRQIQHSWLSSTAPAGNRPPSIKRLLEAADSSLAVTGEDAPVFTVERAFLETDSMAERKLSIVTLSMAGESSNLVLDGAASWNDVALQLIGMHGRCMRVFLVMRGFRLVTPWEAHRVVAHFIWCIRRDSGSNIAALSGSTELL